MRFVVLVRCVVLVKRGLKAGNGRHGRHQTSDKRCYFSCFLTELGYHCLDYHSIADITTMHSLT